MKNGFYILLIGFFAFSNLCFAGGGPGITQALTSLNSPIVVGQDVYFLSTITKQTGCDGPFGIMVDFGPYADPSFAVYNAPMTPANITMTLGPIVFNSPAAFNISQYYSFVNCDPFNRELDLTVEVLPAANIPTLSQWGLISIGLLIMLFGVISLKQIGLKSTPNFS